MKLLLAFFIALCTHYVSSISSSIPNLLLPCYRKNFTSTLLKPPLTMQLLIELIRKMEWEEKDALNMRMFTTSLLHSVRFDGIQSALGTTESEYVVPYRAVGSQFYKYRLLVEYLTPGKPQLIPHDSVTTKELCLLHEIISNTVHVWERGNEGRTCPELRSMAYQRGEGSIPLAGMVGFSKCPIEGGVVKTRWGTISPGHLIAGVASALQETTVNLQQIIKLVQKENNVTKTDRPVQKNIGKVSNIWVSTVAGDLAEVTLRQAQEEPKLGNLGNWNNTRLPRTHYLQNESFDMTSAELLGGLDALIFADKIKDWTAILSRTRFSQLLDMYYSHRGVAYDKSYRACDRGSKLPKLLNNKALIEQTGNVAKLLQEIGAANQYFDEAYIEKHAAKVVAEFEKEAEIAITKYNACEQDVYNIQPLEVIAILDETWGGYYAEVLVSALADALDVSYYGSTLGIINGQSGMWLTNLTYSLVQLYEDLYYVKDSWQTSLRLSKAFETVITYLQNKTIDCTSINTVPRSTVILVMANSALISIDDLRASQIALKSIKGAYPETKIVYVTSSHNSESYQELAKHYANDVVIKTPKFGEGIVPQIVKNLTSVPSRIMDFYCNSSRVHLEDYVTPEVGKFYEIHYEYIRRADFSVKFKGNDYGEASVCIYDTKRPEDKQCKGINGNEEVQFEPRNHCSTEYSCSVQFSVAVTKPKFKCSEFDCRYPDQMRLDISTSWTHRSGSSAIRFSIYTVVLVLLNIRFHEY